MRAPRSLRLVGLMLLVLVVGCAAPKAVERIVRETVVVEVREGMAYAPAAPQPAPTPAPAVEGYKGERDYAAGSIASPRMIIRTANLSVVVEDTDATLQRIRRLVEEYDGFMADMNRWLINDQPFANVTIRVPAQSMNAVLDQLRAMAIKVESENSSGQDVTEEFVDLQARLRNLEATETELLTLLTEVRENRGKAEDILAIHRELTSIRGQIESLKGRSQYLERMTALATIQLQIRQRESPRPVVEKVAWNPLVTISEALRSFVLVVQALAQVAIYVVVFSPIALVPVAVLWFIVWLIRRRKRRPSKAQ